MRQSKNDCNQRDIVITFIFESVWCSRIYGRSRREFKSVLTIRFGSRGRPYTPIGFAKAEKTK